MTTQDEKQFAILMAMLGTAFERGGLDEAKIEMYFEFLSDLNIAVVSKAVRGIIKERKYPTFPTIAEIREAALGSDAQDDDKALAAWSRAKKMLICDGGRDELISEVVRVAFGGWRGFGDTNPEMEAADRAHFMRCYHSICRVRRQELALAGGVEMRQIGQGER